MDFTTENLTTLFENLAARMATERDTLCALDGLIGDADHGIAMEQGMQAAAAAVPGLPTLQDQFNTAARAFLNAVGASSGPLYATALMRAAKIAGPRTAMPRAETPTLITAMAEGIAHRGKAEPGQKTMIDAWHPASEAAKSGATWGEILQAAQTGADATAEMQATLGRAARLGARSLGHKDLGAVSACMIIAEFAKALG
ncbi:dihydroxyacetone kinase subunit DhaL [Cypionkella sp. TWP1-2-1b2]|uniref:dihydroxyacetone kinase subunit DhaL n=1 Tax=Cypionkella sp. TWP1-2-1b2 TaxID=2804675 RepID=UPI003CF33F38